MTYSETKDTLNMFFFVFFFLKIHAVYKRLLISVPLQFFVGDAINAIQGVSLKTS